MLYYVIFIIRCVLNKFKFFKLTKPQQAVCLKKNKLYFEAGLIYTKLKHYPRAIECFHNSKSPRHLIYCYEKLGQTSLAVEIAENYKLYKAGAKLCDKHNLTKKAAYFYTYFDLGVSIKYYKKLNLYYPLGQCYMRQYRFVTALDTFFKCQNPLDKLQGIRQIEEVAITLYYTKQYDEALRLFTHLQDYYSVLECAKKMNDLELIIHTTTLLATYEANENNYLTAASLIAPYNRDQARLYYGLAKANNPALTLALGEARYFQALRICFLQNQLMLAQQISNLWLLNESPSTISLVS